MFHLLCVFNFCLRLSYVSFFCMPICFRHGCVIQQLGVGGYVIGLGRVGMAGQLVDRNAAGMARF